MQSNTKSHLIVRALVEGAIFVALAEILGYIKLWHMPEGGSISLMMVPIVLYALRWGMGHGLVAGFALGILDFMLGGGIALGWQSILGDYVVALTALGLAGVGHKKGLPGVIFGSLMGTLARFVAIWVTGATLWGEWAKDLYGLALKEHKFLYSFVYNLPVLISAVLTVAVCVILYNIRPLRKYVLGEDMG